MGPTNEDRKSPMPSASVEEWSDKQYNLLFKINHLTSEVLTAKAEQDWQRAYELNLQSFELVRQLFGHGSSSVGSGLVHLAEALYNLGEISEAREKLESALSIYRRLDRTDSMRDHLEELLVQVCGRQGHFFLSAQIYNEMISRMISGGSSKDYERAILQDKLAQIFTSQGRYNDASVLLEDSLAVFERSNQTRPDEIRVCCLYLARVFRLQEKYDEAEKYGRRAYDSTGPLDSTAKAISAEELAVSLGFRAVRDGDTAKAEEAIELADHSLQYFAENLGAEEKETVRSRHNNKLIRELLGSLLQKEQAVSARNLGQVPAAYPTLLFVSLSYEDRQYVKPLREILPDYVNTIVFEPLEVSDDESITSRILDGVLATDGLISIDSEASRNSMWTALESAVAARAKKRMFTFDPELREVSVNQVTPRELRLIHLYHRDDIQDADLVMRWLIDERGFGAFEDEKTLGEYSREPMWSQNPGSRDLGLMSVRSFGAVYLVFLSTGLLSDRDLAAHVVKQAVSHSGTTMFCWLDDPETFGSVAIPPELLGLPRKASHRFQTRPGDSKFLMRELDELMVRLICMIYQGEAGGIIRAVGGD